MNARWLRELGRYVANPFRETASERRSIRDEVVFHLTESAREHWERGGSAEQACDAALERFGDAESVVRRCQSIAARGRLRWHRVHLAMTAASLVAIAGLGALVLSRTGERPVGDGDLVGRVVDEQSRPIAAAHVLAVVKTWPRQAFRQQPYATHTLSDGSFEIRDIYPTDEKYEIQISVVAEGRLLESRYVNLRDGRLQPQHFALEQTFPLTVRFASSDGRPIEGVEVFPFERRDAAGLRHCVYFCSAAPIVRNSDAAGAVRLSCYSAGDSGSLYLRQPGGTWNAQPIAIPADERELVITLPGAPRERGSEISGSRLTRVKPLQE